MLSETQKADFERDGYLVVEGLLAPGTLADVRRDYARRLATMCRDWSDRGLLAAEIAARPFDEQIVAVVEAGLDYFQPLDISLPIDAFDADVPMFTGASVFAMMRSARLLDAVEDLIGPEITSNPIQHVRIKPPLSRVSEEESRAHIVGTAWHQDRAVALGEADATRMVTVWLAIGDATRDNGCLQVIPGSHRGDMHVHCPARQLGIPEHRLPVADARALPVRAGGAVLFHPLTVHGSLDNASEGVRWSFDLRYNVTGDPTGRPQFPGFVARSRRDPASELHDHAVWVERWTRARERLSRPRPTERYHRWDGTEPVCA